MSLIFTDPKKYKEIKDHFEEQDKNTFKNTLAYIKNMSESDLGDFLESIGKFLHQVRINNNLNLRSFCKKYNLDPTVVSEIERGLRLPNIDLLDIYLRDDIKKKNVKTTEDT